MNQKDKDIEKTAFKIAYDVCKTLPQGEEKDAIVYYAILAAMAALKTKFNDEESAVDE